LLSQARIFTTGAAEAEAFVLQFILQLIDLIFLHPQFAFEQLLIQITFTATSGHRHGHSCQHR
jgi:hypothetical protein